MKCVLKITEGPAAEQSITVVPGDTITVGRSERAAFVIAGDALLSSLHFSIKCDDEECFLQDLGSTNKTFVNGEVVSKRTLAAGDVIQCGASVFHVSLATNSHAGDAGSGSTISSKRTAIAPPSKPAVDEFGPAIGFVAASAAEIAGRFGLSGGPFESVDAKLSSEELVDRLRKQDQAVEAIRFLALALPKRSAVWWGCQCVRHAHGDAIEPNDEEALNAAETWVADPTEENRRSAMSAAEKLGHKTAAAWAAVAAFWSGGSMGPATAPVVPPAPDLTGKAIFGAVQLACVANSPEKAPQKRDRFIELALSVARGENNWSQASARA